ncbi:uncharacterized protein CANTADRAFT_19267 [Suhomyces tanzawaensis NRRL Y-17324]|uniref:Ribosomal protein bL31m N-terminal domain-containing protein n=1 Tax=Suhomyces tanzawaensis NRRL Y-17324 TaxID=984487 RepID=A0A1E4SQ55_9ASCO|nr:uncharacterized protein CANTADRAFT_19267 [Suhomyces tanzawaensis NRRL Y-17324]ODV81644.1 hypothetical protein CANTADRAFT_19267 [Suhomyces tanzawaensis NRRL Y-17324]
MFGTKLETTASVVKTFTRNISGKGHVHLSNRRVMRKIEMGKARPAIFYQFDTLVELSDGSVIRRRSQAPKDEIRMITDQRNSELWNPNRSDLFTGDLSTGKISKFKQRFAAFETEPETIPKEEVKSDEPRAKKVDDLIEMMGHNAQEIKGGVLYDKKKNRRR